MKTIRQIISIILFKPTTLFVCCIISIALCAMSFVSIQTAGFLWSRTQYQGTYERSEAALEQNVYETAPQYLQDRARDEYEALRLALSSDSDAEYIMYIAQYYDILADEATHGYLSSGYDLALRSIRTFISNLAQSDQPAVYSFLSQYPALLGTLYCLQRLIPFFVLFVPALLVTFDSALLFQRGKALNRAPISPIKRFVYLWLPPYIASLVLVIVICLPMFLSYAIRNGLGSLGYPLVFVQSGVFTEMTVGEAWLRCIALFLLVDLFIVMLVSVLARLSGSALAATFLAVGLLALALSPAYTATSSSWLLALPTTYMDIASVAGRVSFGESIDISSVYGATWGCGLLILGIYSAVLGAILLVAEVAGAPCAKEALAARVPHIGRWLHA